MARIALLFTLLLICAVAPAQTPPASENGLLEKTQSLLDEVGKGMRRVGERAEGLFGPGVGLGEEKPPAHIQERDLSERREAGPSPVVSVSNEFGEIHIDTWDERVVQVNAKVVTGAESASVAEELSRSIDVRITTTENVIQVRPFLPDRHQDMGAVTMQANLYITVPRGASVTVDNFFGDTYVRGVDGPVTLEAQYGVVDISQIGGEVRARARGEFAFRAQGLKQGGQFQLHGSQAEFSDTGGALGINGFGGAVTVRTLHAEAALDLICESTAVRVVLPPDGKPDLTATALYGTIESQLALTRSEQGPRILARHGNPEATQRIDVSATFGDIRVEFEGNTGGAAAGPQGDKPYDELLTETVMVTPYTRLQIEAIRGDIVLEATDDPGVTLSATRIAWVPSASRARAALDALPVTVTKDTDLVTLRTLLKGDPASLGCSDYRVNLKIRYPRNLAVTIAAEEGHTRITENGATVTVEQAAGAITAVDSVGPLTLNNKNGTIRVTGAQSTVSASSRYGDSIFERVAGPLNAICVQGGAVVDKPAGAVTVRANLGNVRLLALDGIAGDVDVLVEEGDLSVVLGESIYSELNVAVDKGAVDSAIPLIGEVQGRGKASYRGIPRQGAYSMKLEARSGDIILD